MTFRRRSASVQRFKYIYDIQGIVGENPEEVREMTTLSEKIKEHATTIGALETIDDPSNNGYFIESVAIATNGDLIALGRGIMTYAVGVGLKTYKDDRGKTQFFWDYGNYHFDYDSAMEDYLSYIDCSEGLRARTVWTN